ncbi:F-box family protein [Wolffia australiana]
MGNLPDELWSRIMEIGIRSSVLGFRELCCLSISCRRLHRLSAEDDLWSVLLAEDFPQDGSSSLGLYSDPKSSYKAKFERNRARKLAAWRLAVLKEDSQISECSRRLEELRSLVGKEQEKLKAAISELRNLDRVRRASVAVQVWQPAVVHSCQRQLVEQCTVPIDSRTRALEMEIKLCNQQIEIYSKNFSHHRRKLDERKEALASLKYHPVDSFSRGGLSDRTAKRRKKQK